MTNRKEYSSQYKASHKEQTRLYNKQYRLLHKIDISLYKHQYDDGHRKEIKQYNCSHYNAEYQKQYQLKYAPQYYLNNKEKCYERTAKRQRNIVVLEHIDRADLKRMYNNKCVFCGQELDNNFHADHLLPVSRYKKIGKKCPHNYNNVAPTCPTCNLTKHNQTPLEFIWSRVGA